ncbi:MAG: tRNA epoxyqueuosine(34) reductase QueG [Calditrichia bacterium]
MTNADLLAEIRSFATTLDILDLGISSAGSLEEESERLNEWLDKKYHGTMDWMQSKAVQRTNPKAYFPEAKCVLVASFNYFRDEPLNRGDELANLSLYARGRDYHKVIRKKLQALLAFIQSKHPDAKGRVCVDSFPLMEKPFARRAGLGWLGKHTNLISKKHGSYFFLGEILLSIDLPVSEPFTYDHCGSCTRCMDACPTPALDKSYQIDAASCISYLTIEHSGAIDADLQKQMGNWVFGCDICQIVCPWNRFSETTAETDFAERLSHEQYRLTYLASLDEQQFEELFNGTPVRRAGYEQFMRNVAIAQKNVNESESSDL